MKLISDYFSLVLVQFSLYLIPLFVTPYIVRTVSPYNYGSLELATNFVAYLTILVSFGFDVTGTRAIVVAKNAVDRSKVFYGIIASKAVLFVLSIVISIPIVSFTGPLRYITLPIIINFVSLGASVIMPGWYFQAIQRLPFFAKSNLLGKILYAIIVVLTVKTSGHYLNIPMATAGTMVLVACFCLWKAYQSLDGIFIMPTLADMSSLLKEGLPFFLSSIMISFYTVTCGFLLGLYTDPTHVAFYSAAAKVIMVAQAVVMVPVSRLLFPIIGDSIRNDLNKGVDLIQKAQWLLVGLGGMVSVLLLGGAHLIVPMLFGDQYGSSVPVLKILVVLPLAVGLSNLYGIQGLINMGFDRWLFWATVVGAAVGLSANMLLTPVFQERGAAGALVTAEIVMTILTYWLYRKACRHKARLDAPVIG